MIDDHAAVRGALSAAVGPLSAFIEALVPRMRGGGRLVYVGAGAAVGLLLAKWLTNRSTRHLAAGLALLAVAGIEPTLVHHNVTALVALLALAAPTTVTSR